MSTAQSTALMEALKSAREWITELAPATHDPRCARLREAGSDQCRCIFDALQDDLKKIDAVLLAGGPEPGASP